MVVPFRPPRRPSLPFPPGIGGLSLAPGALPPGLPLGGPARPLPLPLPGPRLGGAPIPPGFAPAGGPVQPPRALLSGRRQGQLAPPSPPPANVLTDPRFFEQLAQFIAQQRLQDEQAPAEKQNTQQRKRKQPTEGWVRQQVTQVIAFWQRRDQRMDSDYDLYRLTNNATGAGEVVISNMPNAVVNKVANLLASQRLTTKIIPPQPDLRDKARKVEDFLDYGWMYWDDQWRGPNVQPALDWTLGWFLAQRGWVALRMAYNPDAAEREFPIDLLPIDPRQIYPMVGSRGLRYVVHKQSMTLAQIMDEFAEAAKVLGEDRDPTELLDVEAYYDDWYHAVWVDGQVVKPLQAHEYGFVPFIIATGYGSPIRATDRDTQNWTENVGVSVYHGAREVYAQVNKVLSQIATDVAKSANPPSIIYYDPSAPDEPKALNLSPGAVNYLIYDREKAEPINLSARPSDVGPLMDKLLADVARGTLPEILWGGGIGQSGFASSILSDQARDALMPLVQALEWVKRTVNKYALALIRDLHDGPVGYFVKDRQSGEWAGGFTVSPGEIEEVGVENRVTYRDIAPKDRATMAQMASMLTDKKLISMQTAREEYLGLENAERENEQVIADLIYMDEDVLKKVLVPLTLKMSDPEMFTLWTVARQAAEQQQAAGRPSGPVGEAPPAPRSPGVPGLTPLSGDSPPNLGPTAVPPIANPGQNQLAQSLGSILGGIGAQRPPGIPGAGFPPITPPLG